MAAENNAAAVTPSDTTDLSTTANRLYVGGAGTLTVVTSHGSTVAFASMAAGSFLDVRVRRVKATGTTATNLIALW
jgi:hypothetical protein